MGARARRWGHPVVWGLAAALFVAELALVLRATGGRFFYVLDDPYIHLSVAEEIARGGYGVNVGEIAAPASSILWPVLLVPFVNTPLGELAPLLLNLGAAAGVVAVLLAATDRLFDTRTRTGAVLQVALGGVGLLLANLVPLVFTGMEHTLHVLVSALVALGLLVERDEGRVPWWLVGALVLGPLVRYEGVAVSLAAGVVLFARGHRRVVVGAAAVCLAALAAFSGLLLSWGLDALPSSVQAKSKIVASGGAVGKVVLRFVTNIRDEGSELLLLTVLGGLGVLVERRRLDDRGMLALAALVAGGLHLVVGRIGWHGRYEPYVGVFAAVCLLGALRPVLADFVARPRWGWLLALLGLGALVVGKPYVKLLIRTPRGASDIFRQQHQMHRFVVEHVRGPVAVNDLGWVAYRNDDYVLDLWGLASHEALNRRLAGGDPAWMEELAAERGVEAVLIYRPWFPELPESWTPLADLVLDGEATTAGHERVTVFARTPEGRERLCDALDAFAETLPPRARLEDVGCEAP